MVILGCASTPPSPPFVDRTLRTEAGSPADVTGTPALDALRAAAREEVGQPVALGGDGFGVTRVPPAEFTVGPRANATVAEALDALLASRNDAPPSPGPGGMTDAERAAALSAYSAGREALIRGDADTAIDELERASRLDPGSPAVWRSLAEAQLQVGLRASAMVSLDRAESSGLDEPRGLTLAGLDALSRQQTDRGARLLATAERSRVRDADEGLAIVRRAGLGEAFLDLGYLSAGTELVSSALDLPSALASVTRVQRELGVLFRRRPELWVRVGDAHAALGRVDQADLAYERASGFPGADLSAIGARRLQLALERGRPVAAASLVMDRLAGSLGLVTDRDVAIVRSLADLPPEAGVAELIAAAAGDVVASVPEPSATVRLGLTRAFAAAQPSRSREAVLYEALGDPSLAGPNAFIALLGDLIEGANRAEPRSLQRVLARAIDARPEHATLAARVVLSNAAVPREVMDRVEASGSDLARDAAMVFAGRYAEIDATPSPSPASTPGLAAHAVLRADAAARTGRWDAARRNAEIIDDRVFPLLKARALAAQQRFGDAFAVVERAATSGDPSASELVVAADVALLADEPETGVAWLRRAIELDPPNEAAFEGLLAAHSPGGAAADPERLAEVARDLRRANPSGKLIRLLTARELLQRGLLDEARLRLDELAVENPVEPGVLEQRVALARNPRRSDDDRARIEASFASIVAQRPGALGAVNALAAVLTADERIDEAIAAVESAIERSRTARAGTLLEGLYRADGRIEDADAIRRARLTGETLGIDATIELAQLVASGDADWMDAEGPAGVLDPLSEIPSFVELTEPQRLGVGRALARSIAGLGSATNDIDPGDRDDALELIAWSLDRSVPATAALHVRRIELLVASGAELDTVVTAVRTGAAEHPGNAPQLAGVASARLDAELRGVDAATLIAELTILDDPIIDETSSERFVFEIVRVAALSRDADGARRLIDRLDGAGQLPRLLEAINATPDDGPGNEGRPAVAYTMAALVASLGDEERARPFYELALRYDPTHPWAANDLGYQLLEAQREPELVAELIETAARGVPDRSSIIDSLGWLRYHEGRLDDETDDQSDAPSRDLGPLTGLGAISLLRRSVDLLEPDADDGVVREHLADALARAGRTDEAREAWVGARARALAALRRLGASSNTSDAQRTRVGDLLRRLTVKIDAIDAGEVPSTPEPWIASFQERETRSAP